MLVFWLEMCIYRMTFIQRFENALYKQSLLAFR